MVSSARTQIAYQLLQAQTSKGAITMLKEIASRQTQLEQRISQEGPVLDLDSDLYMCVCADEFVIYAPTAGECNAARVAYERIAATTGRARGWGGGWVWVAQDDEYQQFFGATRGEAVTNAMRGSVAASEAACDEARNARMAEIRAEGV